MNPNKRTEADHKDGDLSEVAITTRFNDELDPDNATSPLDFDERRREGERNFYPEGDPEGEDWDDS